MGATYTYDLVGNLTRVDLPDGRVIEYLLDGQNRRLGKTTDGVLVQGWLYGDQLKPVAELDGSGQVVARFVYGSNALVPDYVVKDGATYRLLADHLGSPRLVVDTATGTVVQRRDYDAWGQVTLDTNPGFQPFGFAGGLENPDTGLVRFGARDYDASIGRWLAKDAIGLHSSDVNLYAYLSRDPVNHLDPVGMETMAVGGSWLGGVGAGGGQSQLFAIDDKGNCGWITTPVVGGGYGGVGVTGGVTLQCTTADTIFDLRGRGIETGGSIGLEGELGRGGAGFHRRIEHEQESAHAGGQGGGEPRPCRPSPPLPSSCPCDHASCA